MVWGVGGAPRYGGDVSTLVVPLGTCSKHLLYLANYDLVGEARNAGLYTMAMCHIYTLYINNFKHMDTQVLIKWHRYNWL